MHRQAHKLPRTYVLAPTRKYRGANSKDRICQREGALLTRRGLCVAIFILDAYMKHARSHIHVQYMYQSCARVQNNGTQFHVHSHPKPHKAPMPRTHLQHGCSGVGTARDVHHLSRVKESLFIFTLNRPQTVTSRPKSL